MLGSRAFVRAHIAPSSTRHRRRRVNFGPGDRPRVRLLARGPGKDVLSAVREALEPVESLGVREFTLDASAAAENVDFLLEGIPTLYANQEPAPAAQNQNESPETFEKAAIATLKRNEAIGAVTAYALADREERIGPRQSRLAIERLMKETGLDRQLEIEGVWPAWEKGERGRWP